MKGLNNKDKKLNKKLIIKAVITVILCVVMSVAFNKSILINNIIRLVLKFISAGGLILILASFKMED